MKLTSISGFAGLLVAALSTVVQACTPSTAGLLAGCLPCGPAESAQSDAGPSAQGVGLIKDVRMENIAFSSDNVTIPTQAAVRWTNFDRLPHTTTHSFFPPSWDSGTLNQTDTFTHTFAGVGVFDYECQFHPGMAGVVNVRGPGDATGDNSTNIDDFGILAANFNQPGNYGTGDFNISGAVDIDDFGILAANFNQSFAAIPRGAAVPEPSLMSVAGLGLLLRNRRHR